MENQKWTKNVDQKWTEKGPKMDRKWTENGPKLDQKQSKKQTDNCTKMGKKLTKTGKSKMNKICRPNMDRKQTKKGI